MTNYTSDEVQVREHRLGTITAYYGNGADLSHKGCSGCLEDGKRCFSSTSYCSHITAMLDISVIQNVLLVDHGPTGCMAGIINWSVNYQGIARQAGFSVRHLKILSTNLIESDTVFGAKEKLIETIRTGCRRHNPEAVFVLSTCVSSIIGEDFASVVSELSGELDIPIGFVGCAGLRSRAWASGFDASKHAVINTLVKPPKKRGNTVNFIDFFAQTTPTVTRYLAAIGLEPRFFNCYAHVEDFDHVAEAVATTGICRTLSSYLGGYLEEEYGVPYLKDHFGIGGTESFKNWYVDIARIVGKEKIALDFLNEDYERYKNVFDDLKSRLSGLRAVITMGAGFAFDIETLLTELGVKVLHVNAHHFDPVIDGKSGAVHTDVTSDTPVSISDVQHYETYKILKKLTPDFIIARTHAGQNFAVPLGIPGISLTGFESFGFDGIATTGHLILENVTNRNFVKRLSEHVNVGFSTDFENSERTNFLVDVAV